MPDLVLAKVRASWGSDFKPLNMRDALLRATYIDAINGDSIARQFIADRTEGRVVERVELDDVTPTKIVFEEVRLDGKVFQTSIKRTITRGADGNPI